MKFFLPCLLSLFVIAISSCQKELEPYTDSFVDTTVTDTSVTPVADTSLVVKEYTENKYTSSTGQYSNDSFLLSYDTNGRLLTMSSAKNSGNRFIYTYSGKTYTMDMYENDALSLHQSFFIKSQRVDSIFQYNSTGDTTTEKYAYNGAKQLTGIDQYNFRTANGSVLSSSTSYTYDVNGDLSSSVEGSNITTYTYPNKYTYKLDIGLVYCYAPKHFPDKVEYTVAGKTQAGNHKYTFDALKRLSVDRLELNDGSFVEKKYYY